MVAATNGMLNASAAMIDEILHDVDRPPTRNQIRNLLIVSGALTRQLRKRFESDNLANLTDSIVDQAYRNEIGTVIRNWPASGEWIRPMAFYGSAQLIRRFLSNKDLTERPTPLPVGLFPCLLDLELPVVIRRNEYRLAYASPMFRRMIFNASPSVIANAHFPVGVFSPPSELRRLREERERMLAGERLIDRAYESDIPGIPKIVIYSSSVILDDDGIRVGEMKVLDDFARQSPGIITKVRQRELAIHLEIK